MRIKVIIPALNEERSIAKVIDEVPDDAEEIVVVDNGSTDRTAETAAAHGARVVRQPERGYGAACLAGIDAVGECDVIVFLDADYSDYPEELSLLIGPIERGQADLVIGSRMLEQSSRSALLPQARFGNWLSAFLLSRLFGATVTDLGPFRAIRRDALDVLRMDDRTFGWTVQMQARALASEMRVAEVPVSYRTRIGYSKISGTLSGTVRAGAMILWTIGREFLARRTRTPWKPRDVESPPSCHD